VLPLSISSIFSFPYGHPVAAYAFFLVFPSFLSFLLTFLDEEKDDQFFSFFHVMEHRWNENDREKPKYSGKTLSQCHFVHHKPHMD
jgi:hypothetical protein